MGLNTVILILNDRLDDIIERPEEFSENVIQAIRDSSKNQIGSVAQVICQSHADYTNVIAVGGNCATVLGCEHNGGRHNTTEDRERLLEQVADQMGFRLVRKNEKRKKR
jgi:hypothetical protein